MPICLTTLSSLTRRRSVTAVSRAPAAAAAHYYCNPRLKLQQEQLQQRHLGLAATPNIITRRRSGHGCSRTRTSSHSTTTKKDLTAARLLADRVAKMADYEAVLRGSKYPAKAHARRVVEELKKGNGDVNGVLYLEAQKTRFLEDNDGEAHFRQRRYFYYLTGCPLPDSIVTYDIGSDKLTLFIPPIDPDSVIWSGLPVSPAEALAQYDVDEVLTTDQVNGSLNAVSTKSTVWAIADQVSDSTTFLPFDKSNFDVLKQAIEDCRAIKDEYEVALTRKANAISTIGHTAILKAVKHAKNESELYALFVQQSTINGAPEQAYHSIMASGEAAATLHYVKNDEPMEGKLNLLVDAGAEYKLYASDITRTFPISGKFTKESRQIYDIVLEMQEVCTNLLKEGVVWDDVHLKAHSIAIHGLLKIGILKGNHDEILAARTSVAFFPHGLGHYLGMDTHDTPLASHGNYQDKDTMFRYLRKRGALSAGNIITVEPGIYFCRFIIEPYLKDPKHSQYIDESVLERYWSVGGVRIEDNILITKDGYENLTTAVKDVDEMERLINGA